MRITKYPQSCVVIEADNGARLLIDAGFHVTRGRELAELGTVDAALYTHRHPDHFDPSWCEPLLDRGVPIFANGDVCSLIETGGATTVEGGSSFRAAEVAVDAHELAHMPLVDGSAGPPNLGFVIDGRLLHPGDARETGPLRAELLTVPIAGPSLSAREAYAMVENTGARRAVPIHYDHFLADPDLFAAQCRIAEVLVLAEGETADL